MLRRIGKSLFSHSSNETKTNNNKKKKKQTKLNKNRVDNSYVDDQSKVRQSSKYHRSHSVTNSSRKSAKSNNEHRHRSKQRTNSLPPSNKIKRKGLLNTSENTEPKELFNSNDKPYPYRQKVATWLLDNDHGTQPYWQSSNPQHFVQLNGVERFNRFHDEMRPIPIPPHPVRFDAPVSNLVTHDQSSISPILPYQHLPTTSIPIDRPPPPPPTIPRVNLIKTPIDTMKQRKSSKDSKLKTKSDDVGIKNNINSSYNPLSTLTRKSLPTFNVSKEHRSNNVNLKTQHDRQIQSSSSILKGGERVGWEYHTVALSRVPVYGFGIAVSGGRDNPHFMNGEPSIAISDVLKAGPAEGKLMVNDRVISANGISLENVDYSQAISVLRECGSNVSLLIKRRALVNHPIGNMIMEQNNNPIKVTLSKANKKEDFGIVLGCKIYVKEITNRINMNEKDVSIQEGDIIHKINNTNLEGLTLKEAKKLLDNCKEKVSLVIGRELQMPLQQPIPSSPPSLQMINNRFLNENGNYINGHSRSGSGQMSGPNQRWPNSHENQQSQPNGGTKTEEIYNNTMPNGNNDQNINSIAAMANGRPVSGINSWNQNQNLYVQPPTRSELQQLNQSANTTSTINGLNESIEANDSNSTIGSRLRAPMTQDVSLSQMDQQSSTEKNGQCGTSSKTGESTEMSPVRPLPKRPVHQESSPPKRIEESDQIKTHESEIRYISFHKEGSVGIRLTGGNEVGIFVTAVQPGSPASLQGLQVGDKLLKANGTDMNGFTREEAVLFLLRIQDKIDLVVQNCKQEYENIVANQKGDSFFIRVHFNYDSNGKGELSFHVGDVFHVVDTLFNGVVGSWFVYRLGRNNQEIQKGSIPNKSRADELASEQKAENNRSKKSLSGSDLNANDGTSSKRVNFFKRRRSARRSKSLSKDHWEDVVFGDCASKFSAYERVTLKSPGFVRPVVFFGPLADIAREKFLREYPDKYASPQPISINDDDDNSKCSTKLSSPSGIVRLSSIKDVVEKEKHALLDITPSAVDRLNYAQYYPIVIFMRAENKSVVKELRSRSSTKTTVHRSSRKLFEQSLKLEKLWHHIFTASVTLTSGGDLWYKKLKETIEKQQLNTIWMAETKPMENISDDFLFPMISRLSYASSPESDLDISANDSRLEDEENDAKEARFASTSNSSGRLVKSSSDPSLAHPDDQLVTEKRSNLQVESSIQAAKGVREKPVGMENGKSAQRSPNKQLPLHILLRKELSKALNYEAKDKEETQPNSIETSDENMGNYPTLRACDKYPITAQNNTTYSSYTNGSESPLPPPPPSTLPPSIYATKVQQQYVESPPQIDRNSKPSRFRSAHERLFGSMKKSNDKPIPPSQPPPPSSNNNSSHVPLPSSYCANEDSDYINTSSPVLKYVSDVESANKTSNVTLPQGRFVTGAFGDNSSYSSDSYTKYGSATSTLEASGGVAQRRRQPGPPPLPINNNQQSSLERKQHQLPPPPSNKFESFSSSKAPPSPPPKPGLNHGPMNKYAVNGQYQSLQNQMNAMTLNDPNVRPPPPPKPLMSSKPILPPLSQMNQSDYDNMPAINSNMNGNNNGSRRPSQLHSLDVNNGPPGYYQSLPQSSYGSTYAQQNPNPHRYSSTAETISNFMNGPSNNQTITQESENNYNSLRRPQNNYMEMNPESISYLKPGMSPTKVNSNHINNNYSTNNYEHMRYSSNNGHYSPYNNGPYLNVPYSSNVKSSYNQMVEPTYGIGGGQHQDSSPLPPPPPLPAYPNGIGGTPISLPSTMQQVHQSSGQYLDLSLNRENRGSAFEVYRKPPPPIEAMLANENAMFQGLPPPPPPLTVNDYNWSNDINNDLGKTGSIGTHVGDGNNNHIISADRSQYSVVIATARGIFGPEGGSLVSAETGVSIIIPPGAISEGVTQEIYFKVCKDDNLAPPLDTDKGETLLSPIVMCGPHGLVFNVPIKLCLPHCAVVNPDSWSFALKSSDTNNGEPAGWRNVSLSADSDGIMGNKFNEKFVTVLVDHF